MDPCRASVYLLNPFRTSFKIHLPTSASRVRKFSGFSRAPRRPSAWAKSRRSHRGIRRATCIKPVGPSSCVCPLESNVFLIKKTILSDTPSVHVLRFHAYDSSRLFLPRISNPPFANLPRETPTIIHIRGIEFVPFRKSHEVSIPAALESRRIGGRKSSPRWSSGMDVGCRTAWISCQKRVRRSNDLRRILLVMLYERSVAHWPFTHRQTAGKIRTIMAIAHVAERTCFMGLFVV
jgi:hypothetical protein